MTVCVSAVGVLAVAVAPFVLWPYYPPAFIVGACAFGMAFFAYLIRFALNEEPPDA